MNAEKIIGYFILLTFGGAYASALFWSGWYFYSRLLASKEHTRRVQPQAAPQRPPYWAQGVQG